MLHLTLCEHLIFLITQVSNDGVTVRKTDTETTAWKYQTDELNNKLITTGWFWMNQLIRWLDEHLTRMKTVPLHSAATLQLPNCWEDLTQEQTLSTVSILMRLFAGQITPDRARLEMLVCYTGYRPSRKTRDPETRETINFNLLRLSEMLDFAFAVDEAEQRITPHFNFKRNPETEAEVMAFPDTDVIPAIARYVVSVNENFVSERIRNVKGFLLFVEYGKISVNHDVMDGIRQSLAVTVVHPFSDTNGDNLNEILLMNEALEILDRILRRMNERQHELSFCRGALLRWPAEIHPVEPALFYGCCGWSALFANSYTLL